MKDNLEVNKQKLGIDSWLKLIEEDKNLNGAYISIAQYIWLLEQQCKKQKKAIEKSIEYIENDLQSFLYSIEYNTLLDILQKV